ncbi:MAG: serine hydrolase [Terriglobales bacterium]
MKRLCPLLPALAALLAIAACAATPCRAPSTAERAQINALIPQLINARHVPGLELGLACNGKLVFDRGFGLRDREHHLPVAAATSFQIGSITKQFTAAAILQLRDAGKLSLNDHVARFLPHFPDAGRITIRELLNQTTGLYNYTEAPHFVAYTARHHGSFAAITALLRSHALAFAPGTRWQYSNTNYIVLGQIVALASGEPWTAWVREHIFAPAGMHATGIIGDALPNRARGYSYAQGNVVPAPPLPELWAGSAGAIVSDVADLERWDTALSDGKLISRADYREMTAAGRLAGGKTDSYGFGWMLGTYGNQPTIWHNGGTFGFLALNARLPQAGLDVIVLTNSTQLAPWSVAHAVLHIIAPLPAQAAAPRPAAGEEKAITARVLQAVGWAMSGHFDRTQLAPQMNAALTPATIRAVAANLAGMGKLQSLSFRRKGAIHGQSVYWYLARFANGELNVIYSLNPKGKISGFVLRPVQ